MAVYLPTPGVPDAVQLIRSCPLYRCLNGGTCIDGVCQCPIRYEGDYCQDDLLVPYVVIGCLIGALFICFIAIIAFLIFQRVQEANPEPQPRRILSVQNRHLSSKDRTSALADVEIPPDYDEIVSCEQDQNQNSSRSSKNDDSRTKSEIITENSKCLKSSNNATSSQVRVPNNKVKPSLSFASRLLERNLVGKRKENHDNHTVRNNSARRSNSAPSMAAKTSLQRSHGERKTKRVQGPTRATSVPGKVVQVTMK